MKKIVNILLFIIALISLTSCFDGGDQYCYKINYTGDRNGDYYIIESVSELGEFYTTNNELLGLDYIEKDSYNGLYDINGFYDIYDSYDSTGYFKDGSYLILIIIEENSGSIKHVLKSISFDDSTASVNIKTEVSKDGSSDMSACLMIIEVSNDESDGIDNVKVIVDNTLISE